MKNPIVLIFISSSICFSQGIQPAPPDKAVVYFVRASAMGFAINFSYFDSAKLIGRFNAPKYMRYECEPGPHLFWARSENRDYIEADVEAGKIYFIEASPKMGFVKAGVSINPVDPKNSKVMGRIVKFINKKPAESFTEQQLNADTRDLADAIRRGLDKYKDEKSKHVGHAQLDKSMSYDIP